MDPLWLDMVTTVPLHDPTDLLPSCSTQTILQGHQRLQADTWHGLNPDGRLGRTLYMCVNQSGQCLHGNPFGLMTQPFRMQFQPQGFYRILRQCSDRGFLRGQYTHRVLLQGNPQMLPFQKTRYQHEKDQQNEDHINQWRQANQGAASGYITEQEGHVY